MTTAISTDKNHASLCAPLLGGYGRFDYSPARSLDMILERHRLLPDKPYRTYAAYLADRGGEIVTKARLTDPRRIIAEIKVSGLRGRSGSGYPVALKWESLAAPSKSGLTVVCNATESEPGCFKDRTLLSGNPYAVIEGLLIAAHAIQAEAIHIAIKKTFLQEYVRLKRALDEMAETIGSIPIRVITGPEDYLFGEETALLEVIEGKAPLPQVRKPGSPNRALVHNAETFAHVPSILRFGALSFRETGTADTPGTILVTLCGDVRYPGVYETPAGTTLRALVYGPGGGPANGRAFKAALPGVSSGVILARHFDTPLEFGALSRIGSGLGTAGFILLDTYTSMPRVTQSVARFLYMESCNQCPACKSGLGRAAQALDEIFDPELATPDNLDDALIGATSAPQGRRCALPAQGSILLQSLLSEFEQEFDEQIRKPHLALGPWTLPKIVGYDDENREFLYDEQPACKHAPTHPDSSIPPQILV